MKLIHKNYVGITKPKKLRMEVFVVIQYNNDDNHDAYIVGVYNSQKLAKKKILNLVKREFQDYDPNEDYGSEDSEYYGDDRFGFDRNDPKNLTWENVKKIILEELKRGEVTGLSYLNYKWGKYVMSMD
jgi:hypothetical protein